MFPAELLLHIISLVEDPNTLCSLAMVSKALHSIAIRKLYRAVRITDLGKNQLEDCFEDETMVTKLPLTWTDFHFSVLKKRAHYVNCLHIFIFYGDRISDESLGQICDMLSLTIRANLRHLAIEVNPRSGPKRLIIETMIASIYLGLTRPTSLRTIKTNSLVDKHFGHLLSISPNLLTCRVANFNPKDITDWRKLSLPDSFCLDITCKTIASERIDATFCEAIGPRLYAIRFRLFSRSPSFLARLKDSVYKANYQKLWATAKRIRVDPNAFFEIGTGQTQAVLPATVRSVEYLGIIVLDSYLVSNFSPLMKLGTKLR